MLITLTPVEGVALCSQGGFSSIAWDFVPEKAIDATRTDGTGVKVISNYFHLFPQLGPTRQLPGLALNLKSPSQLFRQYCPTPLA